MDRFNECIYRYKLAADRCSRFGNIIVNVVNQYNTSNPAGRPGRRGELNGTILYFSSDSSSYVQGQFIIVDGGGALV